MAALDDDYYGSSQQMTLEEMARQEYERRRREQERYASPGAPAPMQPSEYVVAQAPVPPPLRANEMPTGPDPRASITSALDMQEPRASFETQAQQGAPAPQRYVPRSGAVPPMYPNPPPVATADVPPPLPDATFPGRQPGVSQATQDILAERGQEAPPPSALTPSELAVPSPPGAGMPGRSISRRGESLATLDILASGERNDLTPTEPAKEGDIIWTAGGGLRRAKGGETSGLNLGQLPGMPDLSGITFSLEKGLQRKGSALDKDTTVVSSSVPPATGPVAAEAEIPVPTVKADTAPWKQKYEARGAVGRPQRSATNPEEPPPATKKASIDPRYLVDLEKSNPALHDSIVQAATAAGIGSWDYANLVYAASKANPTYNEGGRKGLAGLTDEDIQRYQRMPAFANSDPMNPATNLLMGAMKYREVRDEFGPRTPASVAAYYLGSDRVSHVADLPKDQQEPHVPAAARTFYAEATGGPGTKSTDLPALTTNGTYSPQQAVQVMKQAAAAGDPRPYFQYQNDALPRGMTSNDGWRYAETMMVRGFIRAGDMQGAQAAREMLFQMAHVGTNQALMRADQMYRAGDYVGSAKELALAYWATPDGGQAKFFATPKGIIMQRYNEGTGQPLGAPTPLDSNRIHALMQVTKDPMAYQKNVRESQKLNAEIEHKHAETGKAIAETGKAIAETGKITEEAKDVSLKRATAEAEVDRRYMDMVFKSLKPPAGAASRDPAISHQLETEVKDYFEIKDITGKPLPLTPERESQMNLTKDMRFNMPRLATSQAALIAKDLYTKGGTYDVIAGNSGAGWVVHKSSPTQPIAVLSPAAARLFIKAAPPPPPPVIGGTPAPAPAAR